MTESYTSTLYDGFMKIIGSDDDLGRTYLFTVEIDNEFPIDIIRLTAFCRSVDFLDRGNTLELCFIYTKELWEAFENLKENSTFKLNMLKRNANILSTHSFILPNEKIRKSLVLGKFSQNANEENISTFKVYFDL